MNVAIIEYFNPFAPQKNALEKRTTLETKSDSEIDEQEREIIILPMAEEISPKIETSFKSPREYFPSIFTEIESLMKLFSTGNGERSQSGNLSDFLDVPLWDKTMPLTLDLKFQLFTETSPYNDVMRPAMGLSSLNMLSPMGAKNKDKAKFAVPGISFDSIKGAFKSEKSGISAGDDSKVDIRRESKLITLEIPGVLYLNYAFIEKADPVFSNEVTASGFPLWCDLTLTVKSVRPANTNMFAYASNISRSSNAEQARIQFQNDLQKSQSTTNQASGV